MKRYGKARTRELKTLAKLTEHDLAEIDRFREFLHDSEPGKLSERELMIKHGEYMGFSEAEINDRLMKEGLQ